MDLLICIGINHHSGLRLYLKKCEIAVAGSRGRLKREEMLHRKRAMWKPLRCSLGSAAGTGLFFPRRMMT